MKTITALTFVLVLSTAVDAQEKEMPLEKRMLKHVRDLVATVKTVKDQATAEKAKPAIQAIIKQVEQLSRELRKLPEDQQQKIRRQIKPEGDRLVKEFEEELQRITQMPEVVEILEDVFPQFSNDPKATLARIQLRALEKAVAAYFIEKGKHPPNLETLTMKGKSGAFVESKAALKDPWGRRYRYDPKGPHNKGIKPDIWSLGPSGKEETILGNWPAMKKPEK